MNILIYARLWIKLWNYLHSAEARGHGVYNDALADIIAKMTEFKITELKKEDRLMGRGEII